MINTQTVKNLPIPRLIDDSNKTEEEIIAELDLALEQIEKGECISSEEFKVADGRQSDEHQLYGL